MGTAGSPGPVTEVLFAGVGVEVAIGARAVSGVPVGNGVRAAKGAVSVSAGVEVAIGARAASGVPVGNGVRAAKGAVSVSAGVGVGAGTEQPAATASNSKDTIAVTRSFNMPAV